MSTEAAQQPQRQGFFHRLHTSTGAFDIVRVRKRWYAVFGLIVAVCIVSIAVRGFNFGIEFEGGTQVQIPARGANGPISVEQARGSFTDAIGQQPASVQSVGSGGSASIQIRASDLNAAQAAKLRTGLFNDLHPVGANGQPNAESVSVSAVSATWGGEISRQALIGLAVFLVLVAAFLAFYFEKWMALSAIVALFNDIVITAGVYSIIGFEVTPATVIGLLTILGFSLYDTVVVFDKVRENTRGLLGLTRRTYGEAANLAVNQTLMRSINTSLIALLPVLGLLVIGLGLLGVGTLTDLALVQLVGLLCGTFSSICLATPLLVDLKMREQPYRRQAERVLARRQGRTARHAAPADGEADGGDDAALNAELRRERAMSAAAGVPGRTPPKKPAQRPSGKGGRPSAGGGQPSGKNSRPTGKKRR